jgi:glycosyltransferase involved in cell wall biosynthesis
MSQSGNLAAGINGNSGAPLVSIIIPTRNRVSRLARCLDHVSSIRSNKNWELIVVDNGSTDETPQFLERLAQGSPIAVQVVKEPVAGGMHTRNAGARVARGEILIFADDDCYVRPDIVDAYCKIFEDPGIGFAGGRILLHDPTDYPLTIIESEVEVRLPAGRPVPCGVVQGANMALRRQALVDAGGFDARMGPGSPFAAEDWEILTRIGAEGWSGGYFPGPTVSHHHGRKRQEAKKRIHSYNVGSGAVYLKLIANPRTRRIYLPHVLRRILGDMKYHQIKIATQIYGAILFLWQNRHRLLDTMPSTAQASDPRPHSG